MSPLGGISYPNRNLKQDTRKIVNVKAITQDLEDYIQMTNTIGFNGF